MCWLVLGFHSTESFLSWLRVLGPAGALPNKSLTNPRSPCGVTSWALLFPFRDSERCPLQNLLLTASSRTGLKNGNERAKSKPWMCKCGQDAGIQASMLAGIGTVGAG